MNRYMCLACGRFFGTEEKLVNGESNCPYCKDMYFVDNCVENVPPPMFEELTIDLECGHKLLTDVPGDLTICSICQSDIRAVARPFTEERTLKIWQKSELQRWKT